MNLKKYNVVLIADAVNDHAACTVESDDLECPNMEYFDEFFLALKETVGDVIWYKEPKAFIDNISKHQNDIVWSIWSGKGNSYRKGLIPAICEAYDIKYVGADPFVQLLCQDKELSKIYCSQFGIKGAKGVRVKSLNEIDRLEDLNFPIIIKPNAEGGSNGISQENVVNSLGEAAALCKRLLPIFNNDLIGEEYIVGREITAVLAGTDRNNIILKQNEIMLDPEIENSIWGFESKKIEGEDAPVHPVDIITEEMKNNFIDLFFSFEKVELLRIDGRVNMDTGKYTLIELSPDVCMDSTGSVATAYAQMGISYTQLFDIILRKTISSSKML
ncbi:MAG: hypothetical protein ACRCUS_08555 [Anaerovoracaceae bacterium]